MASYDRSFYRYRSHHSFPNQKDVREFTVKHKIIRRLQSHVQDGASQIPNPGDLNVRENLVTINIQTIAADWLSTSLAARLKQITTTERIGETWGDFISLDYETLKEESYEVGRMMIAIENSNHIDDWINIMVRDRIYSTKVWEEECDDPFNERHIRDWLKVHIPALTENPKITENEFGREMMWKMEEIWSNQVPREAIINTENLGQESKESVVGESAINNNQPTTFEEPQVEPAKIAEDQLRRIVNRCLIQFWNPLLSIFSRIKRLKMHQGQRQRGVPQTRRHRVVVQSEVGFVIAWEILEGSIGNFGDSRCVAVLSGCGGVFLADAQWCLGMDLGRFASGVGLVSRALGFLGFGLGRHRMNLGLV
ncbi:hypothetical protein RHSIM_Rhsim10G0173700 [Rhododendron simsii]|uniref:Uncharacterized protein n=1 Tax=Rhododendron simsii TaxID=118357 RepID=A0A834G9S8_RHOSS|nr:hypothetical protein RHSIM_Rhsim10G0173700 [Rhododendron simsii]